MRMHHEDRGMVRGLEGLDGRTTSVAAGGAHDGGAAAALGQRPVHEPREQLHRHVLEGKRRPVKEFEQPLVVVELLQRRHRGMAEACIGLGDHALQLGLGNGAADERMHHRIGDVLIALALQLSDGAAGKLRPDGRDIQAAVPRQAGEQNVFEAEFRGLAPGGNIAQGRALSRICGSFSPASGRHQAMDSLTLAPPSPLACGAGRRGRSLKRREASAPARTR